MGRNSWILAWLLVSTVLIGGCPVGSGTPIDTTDQTPDSGMTTGGGGSSSVTTGGGGSTSAIDDPAEPNEPGLTDGTQVFVDGLEQQFPGCSQLNTGDLWRTEILRLVNVERERAGLAPVTQNQTLENQATQYACEMIVYDFFAHENPVTGTELRDRAEEFEYEFLIIGENLAAGQSTPEQAMSDWMNSPGHRDNILRPEFTEMGVGVRAGGRYGTYWVQEFGLPAE